MLEELTNLANIIKDLGKPAVETGCRLIESLFGEPCKVAGAMLADQVYFWQCKNRVRIAKRAKEIMDAERIAVRILPPGFLLPLLEASGNVDDPDLQELWARLLASGVANDVAQHPAYIDTLRRMSAADAQLLGRIARENREYSLHSGRNQEAACAERLVVLGLLTPKLQASLDEISGFGSLGGLGSPEHLPIETGGLILSPYARQFLAAVVPKVHP